MSVKALVVDDDRDIARLVAMHLEEQGYSVTTAHDGIEALKRIQEALPDFMVLDVEMPKMDGLIVLEQIRANTETAALPVILLTARDQPQDMFEGWQTGADLYLTKPFDGPALLHCVQRIFATQENPKGKPQETA